MSTEELQNTEIEHQIDSENTGAVLNNEPPKSGFDIIKLKSELFETIAKHHMSPNNQAKVEARLRQAHEQLQKQTQKPEIQIVPETETALPRQFFKEERMPAPKFIIDDLQ